jgi:transposase
LEVQVTSARATAGLPLLVVNPRQAQAFAEATGHLTKANVLDAQALAHFAEAVRPALRPLPDAQMQALSARLTQRRQLVEVARG